MSYIFISYKRDNYPYARALADQLITQGFDVWIDDDIEPSEDWFDAIVSAIEGCAAFLILMTPAARVSNWIKRERLLAENMNKPAFPLLLEGDNWPFYIHTQYEDVRGEQFPDERFLARLSTHVNRQKQSGQQLSTAAQEPVELSPTDKLLAVMLDAEQTPKERAAAGRKLAAFGDPRPGVGLRPDGIPDIEWLQIPEGDFVHKAWDQEPETRTLPMYYMARYPVTFVQFEAFTKDGYFRDEYWTDYGLRWRNATDDPEYARRDTKWSIPNHPVVGVNWYEAVAFCNWLNDKMSLVHTDQAIPGIGRTWLIRLPSEYEWEKAGRGSDARVYPWGNTYVAGAANIDEKHSDAGPNRLGRTTAVGIYPDDESPFGVMDMVGNVREWCMNKYDAMDDLNPSGGATRALRGASWADPVALAPISDRAHLTPSYADPARGFRLVCVKR